MSHEDLRERRMHLYEVDPRLKAIFLLIYFAHGSLGAPIISGEWALLTEHKANSPLRRAEYTFSNKMNFMIFVLQPCGNIEQYCDLDGRGAGLQYLYMSRKEMCACVSSSSL